MEDTTDTENDALSLWGKAKGISDLLPFLQSNGFLNISSIIYVTADELKEISMSRLGDRKRVLVAAAEGKAAYEAGLVTTPAPPLLPIPPAPYSYLSPPATPSFSPPSPSNTTIHVPATRAPKRCQKFCHQLLFSGKHTCTKEEECGGLASCGRIDLHPEEKKRRIEEKKVEKAEAKRQKKEEDAVQKAERDALLRLRPEPIWDSWFKVELERLVAAHPDLYSTMKGTRERCDATAKLAQRFTRTRHAYKRNKAIITKIASELKALSHDLAHDEQMDFIRKRKAELEGEADQLVAEEDQREAEERIAEREGDSDTDE